MGARARTPSPQPETWAAEWESGRLMGLDQALAEARGIDR